MPRARRDDRSLLPPAPQQKPDGALILSMWLLTFYVLMITGAFTVFRGSDVMVGGNEMSVPKAIFSAVNAITLTGFRQSVALDQLLPRGQSCIAALMIAGTFITLVTSSLAVVKLLRLQWNAWQVMAAAILAQVLTAVVGGILLLGGGRDFATAMFQAASAFSNFGGTIGPVPDAQNARTLLVLLPLSVLGGLGLPVLMDLFAAFATAGKRAISVHSRIVLGMTALIFLIGLLVSFAVAWPDALQWSSFREMLGTDAVATLNARGAGLPVQAVYSFPRALQWVLIVLMAIGAAPAGTGGGIKVTTLLAICRGRDRALLNEVSGRVFGVALTWLGLYFLIAFGGMLWLLKSQPELPADRALFTAVSAASNIGLSHDPMGINADNAYVLSIIMLLGRLAPIAVLWWMALTTDDADVAVA